MNREAERPEERVLGGFHEPEESREVHDTGHVRVGKLHLADDGVFVRQSAHLAAASTSGKPCESGGGTLANSATALNSGSKSMNKLPIRQSVRSPTKSGYRSTNRRKL